MFNTKQPLICLAPAPWDGPWGTWNQILSRLAERGWPVIYSNGPLDIWERGKSDWGQASLGHTARKADGVIVDMPGRLFPTYTGSKIWTSAMRRLHAGHLRRLAARASALPPISVIFHPLYAHYAQRLDATDCVYFAYDMFSMGGEWTPELAEAERTMVAHSAFTVSVTSAIADELLQDASNPVRVLPSAVDAARFAAGLKLPPPADLAAIPHPRIGYIGRLTPKVNFALIADIARRRPDWHWAIVGPVLLDGSVSPEATVRAKADYAACEALPNVHFLGLKHHDELPQYAANMDVNTICNLTEGGWWVAASPLKLFEYFAVGKPIISSALAEAVRFEHLVTIAETALQWIDAIGDALQHGGTGTTAMRLQAAQENSWERRVDQFERWLQEMRPQGHKRPT